MVTNQKAGFTLIELLVVIALIAILAAILFPVFSQAKEGAKKTLDMHNMNRIATTIQIYISDYEDRFFSASMNEVYGDGHPLPSNHPRRNTQNSQFLFTDALYPYLKSPTADHLRCPYRKDAVECEGGEKGCSRPGSYSWICTDRVNRQYTARTSPFLRVLRNIPPPASRTELPDRDELGHLYCRCGSELVHLESPATTPLMLCDGFGVHMEKPTSNWQKKFWPKSLGGETEAGGVGATMLIYADGHVKGVTATFTEFFGRTVEAEKAGRSLLVYAPPDSSGKKPSEKN